MTEVKKGALLFDGNEKKIYGTDDPDVVLIHFNDVTTAFNGIKRAELRNKGKSNNRISAIAFEALHRNGVPNHFIEIINEREQLCRKIGIIPLQVVVRNRLAGTTARMLGVDDGTRIPNTVFELRYNCDKLADPMINEHHAVALGIVSYEDVHCILDIARRANDTLKELFHKAGIELIDFKMECGRASDGSIIMSDEISPDNSRLWDEQTGEILDKDRFRHDLSDVCASYNSVMERLIKATEQ
ncbi:MAG: phosphoribosylaminoimidazolesuccinocarboxamide synthase [Bacteroidales bacterium]|nr:phosphoribosylaminoimidazolesuccinocarboxamide synthase [Bacteroidales bacterium]